MNPERIIKQTQEHLNDLIDRLVMLDQFPETYIDEYFASLRKEIDEKAEKLICVWSTDSNQIAFINNTREEMMASLDGLKNECSNKISLRKSNTALVSKYRKSLKSICDKYQDAEDCLNLQNDLTELTLEIQDELLNISGAILNEKEAIFIEETVEIDYQNREEHETLPFGHLLIIHGTKLTDLETRWIKHFYTDHARNPIGKNLDRCKDIVNLINTWKLEEQLFIDNHHPLRNLLLMKEIASKGINLFDFFTSTNWPYEERVANRIAIKNLNMNDFLKFRSMKNIVMTSCLIERLAPNAFYKLDNLVSINLSTNRIKKIDFQLIANLKFLNAINLSDNLIDSISVQAFINCQKLMSVNLSFNRLEKIYLASFSQLPELRYLYLSNNQICHIENSVCKVSNTNDAYSEALELVIIPQTKSKLIKLELDNNKLSCINKDDFSSFNSLKILNCSHNQIANIDQEAFYSLENLTELRLNNNNIQELSENLLIKNKKLNCICLGENKLKELRSKRKIVLDVLELDYNVKVRNFRKGKETNIFTILLYFCVWLISSSLCCLVFFSPLILASIFANQ